ncbi:MAG: ribonuclease HII [Magnetococcales bacterium]|nr:ribonuclease HII [Magnetococcales bacterium]
MLPGLTLEKEQIAAGFPTLCGVDEAGRGPLCGPVVAAAVILPAGDSLPDSLIGLDDSKRLSASQRAALALCIQRDALATGIGMADSEEIDRLNIRQATLLAMSRAIAALRAPCPTAPILQTDPPILQTDTPILQTERIRPDFILIDGRDLPDALPCPAKAVIKGDQLSASIAAASILAKTHRDALMAQWAIRHPGYGWERNAGYPTAEHLRAMETLGITPIHRKSYAPVARLIQGS